jgi:hypothetical protein
MRLWNFTTQTYDEVDEITDANAFNYMPQNKIAQNHYTMLREQGEQPIQTMTQILSQQYTWE